MKRTIKAIANQGRRSFMIIVQSEDKTITRYRTKSYRQPLFREMTYNTDADWEDYLRRSDEYDVVI